MDDANRMMTRALSLHLDLMRCLAAFVVPLCHLGLAAPLDGPLALFAPFIYWGPQAVVVFFVLSGFVICHAATTRDLTVDQYAISRLSRVYSVAVPCILLTIAFDQFGRQLAPEVYRLIGYHHVDSAPLLRAALSFGLLNQSWRNVGMFSNTPFWSLCFEFWFYALFATCWYFRGRKRVALTALVGLIAGPTILLLAPVWLLGVLAQRETVSIRWSGRGLWLALLQPLLLLPLGCAVDLAGVSTALATAIGNGLGVSLGSAVTLFNDYPVGASVALHLVAAKRLFGQSSLGGGPALARWRPAETAIRFGASRSFTLYLLHQPTLFLLCAGTATVPGWPRTAVIVAGTFALPLVLAPLIEGQRHRLRRWLELAATSDPAAVRAT
jgi:peptidoglycan/LPS O-acetylase OafA/YrhL